MGNISAHSWQSDSPNNNILRRLCQTNSLAAQNSLGFLGSLWRRKEKTEIKQP